VVGTYKEVNGIKRYLLVGIISHIKNGVIVFTDTTRGTTRWRWIKNVCFQIIINVLYTGSVILMGAIGYC